MILQRTAKATKALEMEDISSIKIQISAEERDTAGLEEFGEGGGFRSRASTLASNSRVIKRTSNLRNHDKLHSRRADSATYEDGETRMVAGASSSEHDSRASIEASVLDVPSGHLRRAGTISGGTRPRKQGSPLLSSRKLEKGLFEDVIGLFLKTVMDKLMDMMQHPPSVNILLTQLLSRLTHYPQPLLRSLLLNHQLVLKPGVPNLLSVRMLLLLLLLLLIVLLCVVVCCYELFVVGVAASETDSGQICTDSGRV
jgi:hypothetical protein